MLETQQERLEKEADTATAPEATDVRWCGERDAHGAHRWPELIAGLVLTHHCYGTTEEGAARMRFRSRQVGPSAVTRDEEGLFDGGAGPYDFGDESGGFK